ncbi:putative deacylase [Undibacterium sp. GrIS 1.8]|uniref:succinylglutamate desuccinylase/aspartoacylase family protein n=1 Tax=unclassified Undibacterium TaxID=2630295 RepID=UPI0033981088
MEIKTHLLEARSIGTQRQFVSYHFGQAASNDGSNSTNDTRGVQRSLKTYIQASLHADEIPGMLVAHHLRARLEALEANGKIRGEIVLVPLANPIGLDQAIQGEPFGRFDLASGINFNRGYRNLIPVLRESLATLLGSDINKNVSIIREQVLLLLAQWQPATEADSLRKTLQSLACDADIVLDLHCDNQSVMHLYTGTPVAGEVLPLARYLGAEAMLLATESGDDPFDETCGRLWWELANHFKDQFPIPFACVPVTVELRGEVDVAHELAEQDADALIAYLAYKGQLDIATPPLPAAFCAPTPLEAVLPIAAPHAGMLVFSKRPGDMVQQGDIIGEVIDPISGKTTPLIAKVGGKMFARTAYRYVQRGMAIAKIAGTVPFRTGKLLSL